MPTTFIVLDTNIFFRFVTQGQPGCERECWEQLTAFLADRFVTLIVPEVVVLEFENKVRNLGHDLAGNIDGVRGRVLEESGKKIWNEIGDLPAYLEAKITEWKRNKIADAESRREEIQRLLESPDALKLPFDGDVLFRSKRRMLAGRIKTSRDRGDADCFIIESLVRFFEGKGEDSQLLLCTENHKDFGVETKDGKKALHPLMKDGLPPTELFSDLASLINFIKEHGKVVEPGPEEVKEAVEREKNEEIEEAIEEALLEAAVPDAPTPRGLFAIMRDMGWGASMLPAIAPAKFKAIQDEMKKSLAFSVIDPGRIKAIQDDMKRSLEFGAIASAKFKAIQDEIKKSLDSSAIDPAKFKAIQDEMKKSLTFSAIDPGRIKAIQESNLASMAHLYDPAKMRAILESMKIPSYLSALKPREDLGYESRVISTGDVAKLTGESKSLEDNEQKSR